MFAHSCASAGGGHRPTDVLFVIALPYLRMSDDSHLYTPLIYMSVLHERTTASTPGSQH